MEATSSRWLRGSVTTLPGFVHCTEHGSHIVPVVAGLRHHTAGVRTLHGAWKPHRPGGCGAPSPHCRGSYTARSMEATSSRWLRGSVTTLPGFVHCTEHGSHIVPVVAGLRHHTA